MTATADRVALIGLGPAGLWASGWRRVTWAAGLGAVSALAFPPVSLLPLLFFTFPALYRLIGAQDGWRSAAWAGFWFGFGLHLVGLYWITEAILVEAARFWWFVPIAVPSLSAVLALFIAAACGLARLAQPGWRRAAALASAWMLLDIARQFVGTGFPWNPLGSVWSIAGTLGDVFLQPAAIIGVHGMTLATILIALAPAFGRRTGAVGVALVLLWGGWGVLRLYAAAPPQPSLAVVIVQGDVAQGHKWDRAFALATFARYLDLTRRGVAEARAALPGLDRLVIWPETASPFLLETDRAARQAIVDAIGPGGSAFVGSVRFDAGGRPRNSGMAIVSAAPPDAVYDKWHLVPFGEYAPSWFPLPIQVVPGGGFAFGRGPATLHVPRLPPLGPLICYEAIFSHQVIDQGDRPALMVNITNDAWFGNSTGPRQHLAAARLRAVEEGLPMARAANTGISAVIDSLGRETGRLGLDVEGVLVRGVDARTRPATVAARIGLAGPVAAGALLLAASMLRPGRFPGARRRDPLLTI